MSERERRLKRWFQAEKRKAASPVFCPKCNAELTLEIAVNTSPNGIPLYPRFCCQKCQIGSYNGKEWWTPNGRWFRRKEAKPDEIVPESNFILHDSEDRSMEGVVEYRERPKP